jgi:ribosomal protein S18 acetylase RimI-like enzyme
MGSVVRPARPEEAEELAGLHLRTALSAYRHIFPPDAPPPTIDEVVAQFRRWLDPDHAGGRRVFVAVDGTEKVGVVMAGPDPDDPTIGHLARLYVAPERWAEGIGRQLYAAAVASLVDAGFPAATLWVLERNTRARTWYERLGWRLTGDRKPTYAPAGIDDVGYRIDLAGPADRP